MKIPEQIILYIQKYAPILLRKIIDKNLKI